MQIRMSSSFPFDHRHRRLHGLGVRRPVAGPPCSPDLLLDRTGHTLPVAKAKCHGPLDHPPAAGNGTTMLHKIRIFGFKLTRFAEWKEVLDEERRQASLAALLAKMFWTLLRGRLVSRAEWRRRMRICRRCPIFGSALRTCRPFPGAPVGCGCWVPAISLLKTHCWATENLPAEERQGFGW